LGSDDAGLFFGLFFSIKLNVFALIGNRLAMLIILILMLLTTEKYTVI